MTDSPWAPLDPVEPGDAQRVDRPYAWPPPGAPDVVDVELRRSPGGEGRVGRIVGRVAVVAVVVGLLAAGLSVVSGLGAAGGADSPEGAVQDLLAAIDAGDWLGAAELIEPSERETLIDPAIELFGELQRLEILDPSIELGSFDELSIDFADLVLTPSVLGPGVTSVALGGTATASTAGPTALFGGLVLDNVGSDELAQMEAEMAQTASSAADGALVAVERDGRWYVSLWYTVAEGARTEAGAPLPTFGAGPAPLGGETPEAAVRQLVDFGAALDLRSMISMLAPDEAAALYDYAPLFLDHAERGLQELRATGDLPEITIERLDLTSTVDGDRAAVTIDDLAVELRIDGSLNVLDTASSCVWFTVDEWTGPQGACQASFEETGLSAGPVAPLHLRRVDGRWYLSPSRTVTEPLLSFVRGLDRAQLQRWIDDPWLLLTESATFGTGGLVGAGLASVLALPLVGTRAEDRFEEIGTVIEDDGDDLSNAEPSSGPAVPTFEPVGPLPGWPIDDPQVEICTMDSLVAVVGYEGLARLDDAVRGGALTGAQMTLIDTALAVCDPAGPTAPGVVVYDPDGGAPQPLIAMDAALAATWFDPATGPCLLTEAGFALDPDELAALEIALGHEVATLAQLSLIEGALDRCGGPASVPAPELRPTTTLLAD